MEENEIKTEAVETVTDAPAAPAPQASKHEVAKAKIAQAQEVLSGVDAEMEACMQRVEEDLSQFKSAEEGLVTQGLRPARQMLQALGVTETLTQSAPAPKVGLEDPELKTVELKKISSGKGSGLMWGLLGGIAALGGWCYTATQALGLELLPTKLPDMERLNATLGWTANQMGQGENVAVGGAIVGVGALALVWLIYWLVTTLRASSNLRVAEKIEADTEFYCTKKGECKEQMKKIREHIGHAQKTVEKYEVLLAELNAGLKRALFIEEAEGYDQLHTKTQHTVKTLQHLADEIDTFLKTPMAEHGILSQEGIEVLERVNKTANDHVMGLYEG